MARSGALARDLRRLYSAGVVGGLSDGELLERFASRGGHGEAAGAALTALVERHGPMVLGVCRRVLANPHDVEDAFQATFLVLVRKARLVRVDDSLGRWLYGVARRVARRARAEAARRRVREGTALEGLDRAGEPSGEGNSNADLRGVLDRELARLPEKYRAPLVLCYLEGLTHEMAAHRLGWPVGTVRGRLARGRERLRHRLAGRGLALPAGLWVRAPLVSDALVETTVRAAVQFSAAGAGTAVGVPAVVAALTEGVLRTMAVSVASWKAAATAVIIAASALAAPIFLAASDQPGGQQAPQRQVAPAAGQPEPAAAPAMSKTEVEAIELAAKGFGKAHWAADKDLPVRYYNHERGYWMYAKSYQRLNEGKQLRFTPFAIIWQSRDGKAQKTATGDGAIIDLDQPLGISNNANSPMKVVHARIEGNVRLRGDKGTPDDLVIDPLPYIEYDEARHQITSGADVVIHNDAMRISGTGLVIALRAANDVPAVPGLPGGLSGWKSIEILKDVHVRIKNVGRAGVLPGRTGAEQEVEGKVPLEIQADGLRLVVTPRPEPGQNPRPLKVEFLGDVEVTRGQPGRASDRLNCDHLELQLAGGTAWGAICFTFATGHGVSLHVKDMGLRIRCTQFMAAPGLPSTTLLSGSQAEPLAIEMTHVAPEDPRKGTVEAITTIRAASARIGENGPGYRFPTIRVDGPGTLQTRTPVVGAPPEREARWTDRLELQTESWPGKPPRKKVTLHGRPVYDGPNPVRFDAKDKIEIWLEP